MKIYKTIFSILAIAAGKEKYSKVNQ